MNTTKPFSAMTEHESANMAYERGMTFVELLDEVSPIPWPSAGYTLGPKSDFRWIGSEVIHGRFILTPVWDAATDSHSVDVWIADHQPPSYSGLTPTEATELSAALLQVTQTARAERK